VLTPERLRFGTRPDELAPPPPLLLLLLLLLLLELAPPPARARLFFFFGRLVGSLKSADGCVFTSFGFAR
jgi:hypothetical protein